MVSDSRLRHQASKMNLWTSDLPDGSKVPVSIAKHLPEALGKSFDTLRIDLQRFAPLQHWFTQMGEETAQQAATSRKQPEAGTGVDVRAVEIQHIDYFGANIGFVKFVTTAVSRESGQRIPGIVFMV